MLLPRLRCHPPRQALVSASNAAFATTLPPYVPSQSKGNLTIEPSVGIEPTPHPYHRCVLMPLNTMRAYVIFRTPCRTQTCDREFRNLMLYSAELREHWYPGRESNPYHRFRKPTFCPLNYQGVLDVAKVTNFFNFILPVALLAKKNLRLLVFGTFRFGG